MRAVNLIPTDSKRGGALSRPSLGPAHGVVGALVLALVFVTVYVLTGNTISDRTAKLASLRVQATQASAEAASLTKYTQFEQLAQARTQTVRSIAAGRFDWFSALADLARVVPADTSLSTLVGTVAPGVGLAGSSTGSVTAGLRNFSPGPAFELTGCTSTQDDVARLMSRLRLINGVTRVTLGDSTKPDSAATNASSPLNATGSTGCGPTAPSFDVIVFFQPLAGAAAQGTGSGTPPTGAPGTTPTTTTPTTPTTTTPTTASPTTATPTTPAPTAPGSTTPSPSASTAGAAR